MQNGAFRGRTASVIAVVALAHGALSEGSVLMTYSENSDSFTSSLSNATVFDFNGLTPGDHTSVPWAGVGVFDQITVRGADRYGGAGEPSGSNYSSQVPATPISSTTLQLSGSYSYLGFWWSAGDDKNVVELFSDTHLVARVPLSIILSNIGNSPQYYGSPVGAFYGQNALQPYAFVNIFAEPGVSWNRIVLYGGENGGFEMDNITVRQTPLGTLPGEDASDPEGVQVARVYGQNVVVVPEPSALFYPLLSLGFLSILRRRRR